MQARSRHLVYLTTVEANIEPDDGVIRLRRNRTEDAPALLDALRESLSELQPWMDWATPAFDGSAALRRLEAFQRGWDNSSAFHFAILSIDGDQFLGECGLDGIDVQQRSCNLGYWVRTSRAGQGIATRAVRLSTKFAFEHLGLRRVEILIGTGNFASQRVAQKIGAHLEQFLKNGLVVHSDVHDAVLYSLSQTDFKD